MGLLRRHDEPGSTRDQMREKLFSIGDDFWIGTEGGQHVFKVNGKALLVRTRISAVLALSLGKGRKG